MAFLDFFRNKTKPLDDASFQSAVYGITEHLTEISERLRRVETREKEIGLQLEGIDDLLHTGGEENILVDALISLADTIGDFYYFAVTDSHSPLLEQAQMMWNKAKSTAEAAGLEIIDGDNEPFDFRLHSAESAERDDDIPDGFIIKILRCGYIYKNEIIRRAVVIVNRNDTPVINIDHQY